MTINAIATGSSGNLYEIIDSKGSNILLEAGVSRSVFTKYRESKKIPEMLLISHKHGDHSYYANEYAMVCQVWKWKPTAESKSFKAFGWEVKHGDVLNYAYLIELKNDNDYLFFATDFEWDTETINPIISDLKMLRKKGVKVEKFLIECNYNDFLFHKAKPEQRIGNDNHFSDNDLIRFLRATGVGAPKVITIHGSDRLLRDSYTQAYIGAKFPQGVIRVARGGFQGQKDLFNI